jgi:hypothetical protein
MLESSLKYSILVFIAVVGLLQASGSYNGSAVFSFFKEKYLAVIFAVLTTGSALVAFFTWNYWSETGVIEGSQQFSLFLLSALLAVIFDGVVSLCIRRRVFHRMSVHIPSRSIQKPTGNLGFVPGKDRDK